MSWQECLGRVQKGVNVGLFVFRINCLLRWPVHCLSVLDPNVVFKQLNVVLKLFFCTSTRSDVCEEGLCFYDPTHRPHHNQSTSGCLWGMSKQLGWLRVFCCCKYWVNSLCPGGKGRIVWIEGLGGFFEISRHRRGRGRDRTLLLASSCLLVVDAYHLLYFSYF